MKTITLEQRNEVGNYVPVATADQQVAWILVAERTARSLSRFTTDCKRHGVVEVYEDDGFNCPDCIEEA